MGSQRVGHNWVTNTHTHTHTHNKDLLYSTGYFTQYSGMKKHIWKECVHVQVWLTHSAVHLKLTQHASSLLTPTKMKNSNSRNRLEPGALCLLSGWAPQLSESSGCQCPDLCGPRLWAALPSLRWLEAWPETGAGRRVRVENSRSQTLPLLSCGLAVSSFVWERPQF